MEKINEYFSESRNKKITENLNKLIKGKWVILNVQDASCIAHHDDRNASLKEIWRRAEERVFQIDEVFIDMKESEVIVRVNTEWGYTYLLLISSLEGTELFDTKEAAQLVYECNKEEY